jgi:hypothetical protein
MASAEAAERAAESDQVAREFWSLVDASTVRVRRFTTLE